jgi:hypothetical protein
MALLASSPPTKEVFFKLDIIRRKELVALSVMITSRFMTQSYILCLGMEVFSFIRLSLTPNKTEL